VHLDAVPGAIGERVGELVADRAVPVDVRLEADRRLRGADVLQHRLEDPVAVDQHLGGIAFEQRRAEQEREVAREGRVARVVQALERAVDLLLGAPRLATIRETTMPRTKATQSQRKKRPPSPRLSSFAATRRPRNA
jgi:hypothetical protein